MRKASLACVVAAGFLFATGGLARAVSPRAPLSRLDIRRWGAHEGFPQAHISALAQTPEGYLWVGTAIGLFRFDGVKFDLVSSVRVSSMALDRNGRLWVGGRTGAPQIVTGSRTIRPVAEEGPLSDSAILSMFEDRAGNMWMSGWRQIFRLAPDGSLALVPDDRGRSMTVVSFIQRDDGVLWGCAGRGLFEIRGPTSLTWLPDLSPGCTAMTAGPDGVLWVGTGERGLWRIDGDTRSRLTKVDGLPSDSIRTLWRDRQGTLWIGTTEGLARMIGDRVEALPALTDAVDVVFEDREDNVWVGTRTGALLRVSESRFTQVGAGMEGLQASAMLEGRDGTLWVGTTDGAVLSVRDGRVDRRIDPVCVDRVHALHEDEAGDLWVGGTGDPTAACRLRNGRVVDSSLAIPGWITTIYRDPKGSIWMGGRPLLRLQGDGYVVELPANKDVTLPHQISQIHLDEAGTLWIVGPNGLWRRKDGVWEALVPSKVAGAISAMRAEPDGSLWLATSRGLGRWRQGRFRLYGAAEGFIGERLFNIVDDGLGALWICSSRGVQRVLKTDVEAFDRGAETRLRFNEFGVEDGLPSNHCEGSGLSQAGLRTRDGKLWFPMPSGLAWIDPRTLKLRTDVPRPLVERVLVNGQAHDPDENVAIPPGHRDFQVDYTAPSFSAPERIRFRHRLIGVDADWVEAGTRRTAYYANLAPGAYRFLVRASNGDGVWGAAEAAVGVSVLPQLHETAWFRGLLAVAALLAIYAAHRSRLAVVRARHAAVLRERARIARDIHDTLAQGFTGIALHLEAARYLKAAPDKALASVDEARSLAQTSLVEVRRAIWNLRLEATGGQSLISMVTAVANKLDAKVRVQVQGTVRPLSPEAEAAVIRVAQEAITNAVRHAAAASIMVTLSYLPDGVVLSVRDDGRGFAPADGEPPGHYGLVGMRERARELGGELVIGSRPGAGTEVTLTLPIPS